MNVAASLADLRLARMFELILAKETWWAAP
jgi:hypothetical protein